MLANSIADTIKPAILPEIEIITIDKKDLIVIQVSHWKGPFYLKKEGTPKGVYIRLGSTSRPASPELLAELQRSVLNVYFDQQPLPDLSKDDLDIEKAFNILDRLEVEGTIVDAVEEVTKFIRRNTRLSAEIKTMRRKDIPEYSPEAVREALINAFAHTDYSMTGSRIQIAIFDNRLEIINPGMLPFGFTLDDLKTGISRIRNRVIVRVFHKLEFMEEWGSGYKRIIEACRAGGYPEPSWEELGTMMRVIFYPSAQTVLAYKDLPIAKLEEFTDRENAILRLFEKRDSLHFRQIFEQLVPPISERMLRYNLAELKRKGLLNSKGMGRAIVWQRVETDSS